MMSRIVMSFLELAPDDRICLRLTEQIKPQHIISEDSLDNDDEPRKGKLRPSLLTPHSI